MMDKVIGWCAYATGNRAVVYELFDDGTWQETGCSDTRWAGVTAFTMPHECEVPQRKFDVAAGAARDVVEYANSAGDYEPRAWSWVGVRDEARVAMDLYRWSRMQEGER